MKMLFTKTGFKTGAFSGDKYRSEYIFTTESNLPVGSMIYQTFSAVIKFDERTLIIKSDLSSWSTKYNIIEDDTIVGYIKKGGGFSKTTVELLSSGIFTLGYTTQSYWQRLFNPSDKITLGNAEDEIHYLITQGVRYEWGYHIREESGEIEASLNGYHTLAIAFLGMFLFAEQEHSRD